MKNIFICLLIIAFIPFAFSKTKKLKKVKPVLNSTLANTSWSLTLLKGEEIAKGSTVTLVFTKDSVAGNAGYNQYSGKFINRKNKLKITDTIITEMAGPDRNILKQESDYIVCLHKIDSFVVEKEKLVLISKGKELLQFKLIQPEKDVSFEGSIWKLNTFFLGSFASPPPENSKIELTFNNKKVDGWSGCGKISGEYTIEKNKIQLNIKTEKDPKIKDTQLIETENQLIKILSKVEKYEIHGKSLKLLTNDEEYLEFLSK